MIRSVFSKWRKVDTDIFSLFLFPHLFARKLDAGARLLDDVFENGRKRRDSNSSADHDAHVVAMPVLVTFSVRTVHVHLPPSSSEPD